MPRTLYSILLMLYLVLYLVVHSDALLVLKSYLTLLHRLYYKMTPVVQCTALPGFIINNSNLIGMSEQEISSRNALKLIAIALSIYIIWVAATYILEGRIHLFQKVDPIGRMAYVVIANIAIGTVLSAIAIRYLLKAQLLKPEQLGLTKSRL